MNGAVTPIHLLIQIDELGREGYNLYLACDVSIRRVAIIASPNYFFN